MADQIEPEIILYDLACTKDTCFSPTVWQTRLVLNYKNIPYKTIFLEFPDIGPTLKELGIPLGSAEKWTVPAIHHIPTQTYMMDSGPIAEFLESKYPSPPLNLNSALGIVIKAQMRSTVGRKIHASILPREITILSPRSQDYFRKQIEGALGYPLENLLNAEEERWKGLEDSLIAFSDTLQKNKDDGPWIDGKDPSYQDFFVGATLKMAKVVGGGVWERMMKYPGYAQVFEACSPYMEKTD